MGIIVIVVAAKYSPNFTPSNIKKIWTWQSQTWWNLHNLWMLRWRPNPTRSPGPLQRSFESYCGRWSDSMSSMNIPKFPNLFSIGNFASSIFRPRVCSSGFRVSKRFPPQDLEKSTRISSVRLILCHEGCLFRKNPSILLRMCLISNGEYDNVEYEKYDVLS